MNTRLAQLALFLTLAFPTLADEHSSNTDISASSDPAAIMQANADLSNWRDPLTRRSETSALRIGNSDYTVTSPVIQAWRSRGYSPERPPLWKRIVMFPVYLLTPQPMASPPGGGRYFKWKEETTIPWAYYGGGAAPGETINLINHEPVNRLMSVGK